MMPIVKDQKQAVIADYRTHVEDTGSPSVQIALLTQRINQLGEHFKAHQRDHHSRRGLLEMVNRRRKLLEYVKRTDAQKYQELLERLKLRK